MIPPPETLRLLADLLAYPRPGVAGRAAEAAAALADVPEAAERLARFALHALVSAPAALEEAYTSAFDLAPLCSPYLGDQLFGASGERARLLAGLRQLQRDAGVEGVAGELPDHVAEVLRLVAAPLPDDVRSDLVADGLAPVLCKMLAALEGARHPWADPVGAALEALAPGAAARPAAPDPAPALEALP